MLFVFQVDTGRMMTFDMSVAFESVETLKCHVERACHIPVDKQVLLISGGVYLEPQSRVCSHAAGTDTNPIFLFSKAVIESVQPPNVSVEYGSEQEMPLKVREATDMPATYATVQKRTQLAHLFFEMGQEQTRICEKLVHEQHLQQQGWSAVVANLEDLSSALRHRWELYQMAFQQYINERNSYIEFLTCFKDDLRILQKIPVLPALMDSQKILVPESEDASDKEYGSMEKSYETSLYHWITQKDDFMECLYENCCKGLHQIDETLFAQMKDEVEAKLAMTEMATMKEVKGLGDRLFGLEKLMVEARRYVTEQMDLAKSFKRNNARASQCKEASVLPDLCVTHLQQLNVMLTNHNCLRDITRRCICAKNELSSNLYHRLKWVVFMEDNLSELDNKLVFNFQNLLSLQRQLDILQQVHTAPNTYLSAILEVVRRRAFSQGFMVWASDIACRLMTIHNEELARRKDFQANFEGHFLKSLFPGMDDLPPPFATQAPSVFDSSLPKLSQDDVDRLKLQLPELADLLRLPAGGAEISYLMLKDKDADKIEEDDEKAVEEKLIEVVNEAGLASNMDQNLLKAIKGEPSARITPPSLSKDLDKGCESETDTEEFEKVSQSPFELHFDSNKGTQLPRTQDASTLTEDNLQISRTEYEKIRSVFSTLSNLAKCTNAQLKSELAELKNYLLQERARVEQTCSDIFSNINNIAIEREIRQRESIQRLTVDHELEISDFRKIAQGKNEEMRALHDEVASLRRNREELMEENVWLKQRTEQLTVQHLSETNELEHRLEQSDQEKERAVKEVSEKLKSDHRAEVDNIRQRFKLMTTMERSPSESSLEKIERGDYSSLTNHEALLTQMSENFESEKAVAISDAVAKESQKWQKTLNETVREIEMKHSQDKEIFRMEVEKRVVQDKDKQIDTLTEQIRNLALESLKLKSTVQQLTECNEESVNGEYVRKIDDLEREKRSLQLELDQFKRDPAVNMAASVAVCQGAATCDSATSPLRQKKPRIDSLTKIGKQICVDTCKTGDLVLVVWEPAYQNYKILQENRNMHFLNSECMEALGLKIVDGQPNQLHCCAEVVEKEYCHAKKPINRFRVPQGTKFFRVKVKPSFWATCPKDPMEMSQIASVQSTSSVEVSKAETSPASPPPPPAIPEEVGEDSSVTKESEEKAADEDVEKATELTEMFSDVDR